MRSLRVRPGPTALAVLTPAVAIAAAMYTVLRGVLLRDLPGARKPS